MEGGKVGGEERVNDVAEMGEDEAIVVSGADVVEVSLCFFVWDG